MLKHWRFCGKASPKVDVACDWFNISLLNLPLVEYRSLDPFARFSSSRENNRMLGISLYLLSLSVYFQEDTQERERRNSYVAFSRTRNDRCPKYNMCEQEILWETMGGETFQSLGADDQQ